MEDLDRRIAIVGAGYAGMAAAVTLAVKGIPVTVFESGAVPGGRARRIVAQGIELDNGQHILVGAYETLFDLMHRVGVPSDAVLRIPLELRYARGFSFRALWAPPPLGLLGGLLFAKGVRFAERLGALRFMRAMAKSGFRLETDTTVHALLRSHAQAGLMRRYFWGPLCVSALNTPDEEASAAVFLAVLRDTLARGADASDLLLPRVDLSRLFPEPAVDFVRRHGGEVRLRHPVRTLRELAAFGAVILAVGPHQLKALLPAATGPSFAYQPIYTCYLQYPERTRLTFPMLGMSEGLVQWVFDRGLLAGERGRLACVISARGPHQALAHPELAARCHGELAAALPGLPQPLWSRVIAEKRATVACTPARPRVPSTANGAILAGDYTDADYPPTLEAAVRSGVRAAEHAAQRLV